MKMMEKMKNNIIVKQDKKNKKLKIQIKELKNTIKELEEEREKLKKFNIQLQATNYEISYNNIDLIEQRKKYQKRCKQLREEKIEIEKRMKDEDREKFIQEN